MTIPAPRNLAVHDAHGDPRAGWTRRRFLRVGSALGCGLAGPAMLGACVDSAELDPGPPETFAEPTVLRSADGLLDVTLVASYLTTEIDGQRVTLRSYGARVGPTLVVDAGDTLRIRVVNELPVGSPVDEKMAHLSYPNHTNLHAHGLHVSPEVFTAGVPGLYGDYVMDPPGGGIAPGESRQYEYVLRSDHPAGMCWYHPHLHGSSALQVASWMSGALIVKGAIDELPEMAAARELVFVFQAPVWNESGGLEHFTQVVGNPTTNARPWMVNGVRLPRIVMRTGEVQNWRLLNAGIFNFLNLSLDGHVLHQYGRDGNEMRDYRSIPPAQSGDTGLPAGLLLAPGNRASAMVKAQAPGTYYLRTAPLQMGNELNVLDEEILAEIVVRDPPLEMTMPRPPFPVSPQLAPITDAELAAGGGLRRSLVMRAIANPWPGTSGRRRPITEAPANQIVHPGDKLDDWVYQTGKTTVADTVFAIGASGTSATPGPIAAPSALDHPSEYLPFQSSRALTQIVALGSVEEWTLFNMNNIRHPFHIHVNPMYVVRVNGVPVEPYWADTVALPPEGSVTRPTSITVRMRFTDYRGSFAMHCHMLAHEDLGMMQAVRVV